MVLLIALFVIAACLTAYTTYLLCTATSWWWAFSWPFAAYLTFLLLFALILLVLMVWSFFINKKKPTKTPNRFYMALVHQVCVTFLFVVNVHVHVHNERILPPKGTRFMLINNHVSNFDQMSLIAVVKESPMVYISKPGNFKMPLVGAFIYKAGFLAINREDAMEGYKTIKQASDLLAAGTCSICISPEGTRNKTNETMLPFHPGSFRLASWAKAPIVICSIKGTREVKHRAPFRPSRVDVTYLKVLRYEDYQDKSMNDLAAECHDLILSDLESNGAKKGEAK